MLTETYKPGSSFVHNADPRVKIILLIILTASFFTIGKVEVSLVFLFLAEVLVVLSCGWKEVFKPYKTILPILVFVLLLTPPFHKGGEVYLQLNKVVLLTSEGTIETLKLIIRFSGITNLFFLFFRTTEIDEIILSLRWFGIPYTATLIITISMRYLPLMISSYNNIRDAHKLRGNWSNADDIQSDKKYFRWQSMKNRISNIFPILVSVLITSIKAIPTLAMALELKGLGRSEKRSQYHVIKKYASCPLQILILSATFLIVCYISFITRR